MHYTPIPDGSKGRDMSGVLSPWTLAVLAIVGTAVLGGTVATIAVIAGVTTPALGFAVLAGLIRTLTMYSVAIALSSAGLPPGFVAVRAVVESVRSETEFAAGLGGVVALVLECGAIVLFAVSVPVVVLFAEFWSAVGSVPSLASLVGRESIPGLTGDAAVAYFLLGVCLWFVAYAGTAIGFTALGDGGRGD